MKPGPYLLLPMLGPSTVRDTFGKLVDQFTYPLSYLQDDSTRLIVRGVNLLDIRASLLDLDAQIDKSYDRYAFVRNAWLQRREFQVTDGNVEDDSQELEQGMEPEPAPEATPDQATPGETPPPNDATAPPPGASGQPAPTEKPPASDAPATPPPQ